MRLLRHPYVVKLYEVMTSTRGVIIVMEYIKGCDFFDKIMDNFYLPYLNCIEIKD